MAKQIPHKHGQQNMKARRVIHTAVGSIGKISDMIEKKRYCPEIIQQIDSIIGLLKSARAELLRGHLDSCLAEKLKMDKEGAVAELLKIYKMK